MIQRRYSNDPTVEKSLQHSVRDGISWAVMVGFGESYFSAFALFLKATTEQIGLLASLPSLLGSLAQLLSAWLLFHSQQRKLLILTGVIAQATVWFAILSLPFLPLSHLVGWLILTVILYQTAGHFANPVWSSLMGDLVPEQQRGRYFARRTALINITLFISLTLAGLLLQFFQTYFHAYIGFMVIFGIAITARFYCAYQIYCMYEPKSENWLPLRQQLQGIKHSEFLKFSLFIAALNFAVAIASPFFSVYMLRDLHFSYLEFSFNTASFMLIQFLTLNIWGRFSDTFGNRIILIITALMITTLPLWWVIYTDYWYLVMLQMIGGLLWGGFSLSAGNLLYDTVNREQRAAYSSIHSVFVAISIFFGALLGGYLASHLPIEWTLFGYHFVGVSPIENVFIISTLMRFLVILGFLFLWKRIYLLQPFSFKKIAYCLWPSE